MGGRALKLQLLLPKKLGLPLSESESVEICDIMIVALFVQTSVSLKTKKHIA